MTTVTLAGFPFYLPSSPQTVSRRAQSPMAARGERSAPLAENASAAAAQASPRLAGP